MTRKRAPSARQAQELAQWLHGQRQGSDGQALLSALVRLSTVRGLQAAREHEQAATLASVGSGTNATRRPARIARGMKLARSRRPQACCGGQCPTGRGSATEGARSGGAPSVARGGPTALLTVTASSRGRCACEGVWAAPLRGQRPQGAAIAPLWTAVWPWAGPPALGPSPHSGLSSSS